jgi:uncharacterized protein (DUF4415 family)
MKKQYDLKRMTVKHRGPLVKPTAKVQKTIRLDLDVLSWLVEEAHRRGLPYQTLINSTLKEAMVRSRTASTDSDLHRLIRSVVRAELKKAS